MATEDAVVLAHEVDAAGDDYASAFLAYNKARYLHRARATLRAHVWRALPRGRRDRGDPQRALAADDDVVAPWGGNGVAVRWHPTAKRARIRSLNELIPRGYAPSLPDPSAKPAAFDIIEIRIAS